MSERVHAGDRGDLKSTTYEFFMLAIAILSIANLPLLAMFPYEMLTVGVALFATFAGFLANLFLSPRTSQPKEASPELADLHALLDTHEETTAQLRSRLEALEAAR